VRIEAVLGDITTERVDAVVNAANASLLGGGGVDGAIRRAAGPELARACVELGGCEPGDAKATSGFRLPAKWVIHTVGPIWRGGHRNEEKVLASCYRRCLTVADELEARSMAFPAISTGVYGFPTPRAAEVAVLTLVSTDTSVDDVRLVAFDEASFAAYRRLLDVDLDLED
jgi:O-acetyl-ADP-ribose deacetylase (regulator of RNase III)